MARLRQQFPQNYGSSGNINTEFEQLVRYINAAEYGGNTLAELLAKIFDADGVFDGPVELRKDSSAGLQYRVGEYTDPEKGWITLATLAELRGEKGQDVGTIGAPIIHSRQDTVATSSQTVFDYAHDSTDELLVYVNGVLKRPGASHDYTTSPTAGSSSAGAVTFTSGQTAGHIISIYKIRATAITGFTRSDTLTTASQTVFSFVHDETTKLQVYKNGLLQREGGSNDYTSQAQTNTVTFNSAVPSGNLVTIVTVENTSTTAVTGMMFESDYVDTATGLIQFAKIGIADGAITQAKVANLVTGLGEKAKLSVASSTPGSPASGDLWVDTSISPNQLKFYDGSQFLRTSPESSLPTFTTSDSAKVVRVNGTGTALEYVAPSTFQSGLLATTQRGAANGVASLDSSGRLPSSQLPTVVSTESFYNLTASPTNGDTYIKRIFKQKIQIVGAAGFTSAGTIDVQVLLNGVATGSTLNVSSSGITSTFSTPIEADATTSTVRVGFRTTNNASAANLEVVLAVQVVS